MAEAWVSLLLRSPWKSRLPLRPGPGGLPDPSLGWKLLGLLQASISVPSTDPAMGHHGGKELHRDLTRQQPVAVLREDRGVPHRIVNAEIDEPAEQQVQLDALDQLALRADTVECLQ